MELDITRLGKSQSFFVQNKKQNAIYILYYLKYIV